MATKHIVGGNCPCRGRRVYERETTGPHSDAPKGYKWVFGQYPMRKRHLVAGSKFVWDNVLIAVCGHKTTQGWTEQERVPTRFACKHCIARVSKAMR